MSAPYTTSEKTYKGAGEIERERPLQRQTQFIEQEEEEEERD